MTDDFEADLEFLKDRIQTDNAFAVELYRALCNMRWQKIDNHTIIYSCSWRYAGGLIAMICGNYEPMSYCDYYCSGNEGVVSENVRIELEKLGWVPLPWGAIERRML